MNEKGYLRITRGPYRGRYVHRHVMSELCAEFCFYPLNPRSGLPDGFHVEHLDHKRQHNCHQNLLLLDARIHDHLSWSSWLNRPMRQYISGQEPLPPHPDDRDPDDPWRKYNIQYSQEEVDEVPF